MTLIEFEGNNRFAVNPDHVSSIIADGNGNCKIFTVGDGVDEYLYANESYEDVLKKLTGAEDKPEDKPEDKLDDDGYVYCHFCGRKNEWWRVITGASDYVECTVHYCNECGRPFCVNCFSKSHGRRAYDKMFENEAILCHECYQNKEGKPNEDPA